MARLSRKQRRGIRDSYEIADYLVKNFGVEVVCDYRRHVTELEIATKYVPDSAKRNNGIAVSGVSRALEKLLSAEERRELAVAHREAGGYTSHKRGVGIHALTSDDHRKNCLESNKKQGKKPAGNLEKDILKVLVADVRYQHDSGPQVGKPNYHAIQTELAKQFPKRTIGALRTMLYRLRK